VTIFIFCARDARERSRRAAGSAFRAQRSGWRHKIYVFRADPTWLFFGDIGADPGDF